MALADTISKHINAESKTRYRSLGLPDEWIAPNYNGRSIVNVTASVIQLFGGEISTPSLEPAITRKLFDGVERVVLVVVDALGYQRLLDALEDNPRNGFASLVRNGGRLVPLTSVFPSTTTAALTSLWTGYTPVEHGFLGYQLFLRDFGARSDMILFSPVATRDQGRDQLLSAGLEPDQFLAVPSLPQTLASVGVPVYHLLEYPFVRSGLSRVQIRGAKELRGFITTSDLWVVLREWVEEHASERGIFAVYWSAIDAIAHYYGPSFEGNLAEINNFAYSFERDFLRGLSSQARERTLFLLTADHGQMDAPPQRIIYLSEYPQLREHLLMDFAGEPRAAYLYCRNGEVDAARRYLETQLADRFFVLDSQVALDAGLFGSGTPAPEARHRIGDLIVLPRADYSLVERRNPDAKPLLGRHGGLATEEMLVPLLAARLDA